MKLFLLLIIIVFIKINIIELKCLQAWNGGGTGAWYRVDTSCEYSFVSTQLIYCFPTIILPMNKTTTIINDGFYISLGIFNRFNGISLDIGLTFDWKSNQWFSYGNDRLGWKSGKISIDSTIHPCINVSLSFLNNSISYLIRTQNGSMILGEDKYFPSQIDPLLNFTQNNSNQFGFYRFDSIAQDNETLQSGSQMIHAQMTHWILQLDSGLIVSPNQFNIASNVHGYSPGPCCTSQEINTIHVYQQIKWNQSDISISYLDDKQTLPFSI